MYRESIEMDFRSYPAIVVVVIVLIGVLAAGLYFLGPIFSDGSNPDGENLPYYRENLFSGEENIPSSEDLFEVKIVDENGYGSWENIDVHVQVENTQQSNKIVLKSTLTVKKKLPPPGAYVHAPAPYIRYYKDGERIATTEIGNGELDVLRRPGGHISKISLEFVRAGEFELEAVYPTEADWENGGGWEKNFTASVKVDVEGPYEPLENVKNRLKGFPVQIRNLEKGRSKVVIGKLPKSEEEKKNYQKLMENTFFSTPEHCWMITGNDKNVKYHVRMYALNPRLIEKTFRYIYLNLSGEERKLPITFTGDPKKPAYYTNFERYSN
ncbi:hypothetical protein AKJ56_00550 [candidate division MSBL1 archaeon SCGC-AAA382N08]|uniref:Uncharacterized protein n=1 Tax=candidate division MSBL1 archaeon SCGC-AAA382N08 TaxID=1698285 RepID=A0A133VQF3_9EURY|nr:hypothetical protein AKJ56_00550 [candidate division MSBL1 archaeon SCGC-AAA382N08]